ncbi:unnamed protein product [Nesidiocoris tenuis]|uniref:PX domain-containing protein n=1 Tax=Nesidiocoris tenuis TaxID=355587 RepID=A0A6H5HSB4_9HEMI|nr:unnamed protein product [Nesidiocoris tenuis]
MSQPDFDEFVVNVDNPQKHFDPLETYVTFRVTTKALPAKHSVIEQLDRYSRPFILSRMAMLHSYLQRLTGHPVFSCCPTLKVFLTAKSSEFTMRSKVSPGILDRLTGSLPFLTGISARRAASNPEFKSIKTYVNNLGQKLTAIQSVNLKVYKERLEFVTHSETSLSFSALVGSRARPGQLRMIPLVFKRMDYTDPDVQIGYKKIYVAFLRFSGMYPNLTGRWYYFFGVFGMYLHVFYFGYIIDYCVSVALAIEYSDTYVLVYNLCFGSLTVIYYVVLHYGMYQKFLLDEILKIVGQAIMANIEKVKVLVLGDSGVGKTSLTHLIAHNEPISNPSWTVGCSVEVKLHEFREGTPTQKTYFVELWDIGGSSNHRSTRNVFYNPFHGIIFVHDLTNRKSQQNLKQWLAEVMSKEGGKGKMVYDDFDSEVFAGSVMNCMDPGSLAPGSSSAVKLSRFFDKVIEVRYYKKDYTNLPNAHLSDKRRFPAPLLKLHHGD